MGTNELILQKVLAGIESVHGTAVPATRKVYADVAASYERGISTFTDKSGTRKARRRVAYGRESVGLTATDQGSFEDLPWWFEHAIAGGVTVTADAGTPPSQTRIYVPDELGTSLKSSTFEHGEPSNVYETDQVMVNSWTLRGDADSDDEPAWMFEAEMLGRNWVAAAYTGSISDRDTELILARGTKVYVDDAGGSIGTTQLLGKLISWSISGNNNIHYKAFAEDEAGFAKNKVGFGEVTIDAQLTMEFDDDVEFAKYRNTTAQERIVRLERVGSIIHTTVPKLLQVDLYGFWDSFSPGDREGNMIATMNLRSYYNTAAGHEAEFTVVNDLATLV